MRTTIELTNDQRAAGALGPRQESAVKGLFQALEVLPVDLSGATHAARLRQELDRDGAPTAWPTR